MDEPLAVRCFKTSGGFSDEKRGSTDGERSMREHSVERLAFEFLHQQIDRAVFESSGIEGLHDAWVASASGRRGLALETDEGLLVIGHAFVDDLERAAVKVMRCSTS
ncbi:MAG: hypothetical protein Q8S33_32745 [Myxococcales bacterium]|nr:hypothetical protein [Myxococcales bacterium]